MTFKTDLMLAPYANHKYLPRITGVMAVLEDAVAAGQIYNVDYKDIKSVFGDVVSKAWNHNISEPFVNAGKWESLSKEDQDLAWDIHPYNLHDVQSASKKLAKVKHSTPVIVAMRNLMAELLPISNAVKDLKDKVIMGRKPAANPKAAVVNPNKLVQTCPCCLRQIAVRNGLMVAHGFERPGHGYIIGNCHAVNRFKPLEVSSEGAVWMIGQFQATLEARKAELSEKDNWQMLVRRTRYGVKNIIPTDSDWKSTFENHVYELERDIRHLTKDIEYFTALVAEWDAKRVSA